MKAAAPEPKGARMPRALQADRSSSSVRFSRPSFSMALSSLCKPQAVEGRGHSGGDAVHVC